MECAQVLTRRTRVSAKCNEIQRRSKRPLNPFWCLMFRVSNAVCFTSRDLHSLGINGFDLKRWIVHPSISLSLYPFLVLRNFSDRQRETKARVLPKRRFY